MKYKGDITIMFEQGCECWPQFHDYRGRHGDKLQYWNWDWTINFGKETKIKNLKIWNDKNELIYNNSWTYDCEKTLFFPSPKELISVDEWYSKLTYKHYRCELETDEVLDALKKHNKEKNL